MTCFNLCSYPNGCSDFPTFASGNLFRLVPEFFDKNLSLLFFCSPYYKMFQDLLMHVLLPDLDLVIYSGSLGSF